MANRDADRFGAFLMPIIRCSTTYQLLPDLMVDGWLLSLSIPGALYVEARQDSKSLMHRFRPDLATC